MRITNSNQLLELQKNKFIGTPPQLINSQINFNGENNILVCEENVRLVNSRIDFNSDNSILYLSSSRHNYSVFIVVNKEVSCFIGKDNYFNGRTTIVLSEAKHVVIGCECNFSYNVVIRVSDAHPIYDADSKNRVNYAKSIFIGDHVWLGQDLKIYKGTQIGSGAIIGANSVLSNKIVPSNSTFAGSPARLVKNNVFWSGDVVHNWGKQEVQDMSSKETDSFIYEHDESSLSLEKIDNGLDSDLVDEKYEFIKNNLLNNDKNRFFIGDLPQNDDDSNHSKIHSLFKIKK